VIERVCAWQSASQRFALARRSAVTWMLHSVDFRKEQGDVISLDYLCQAHPSAASPMTEAAAIRAEALVGSGRDATVAAMLADVLARAQIAPNRVRKSSMNAQRVSRGRAVIFVADPWHSSNARCVTAWKASLSPVRGVTSALAAAAVIENSLIKPPRHSGPIPTGALFGFVAIP
jgi:hypothetical protein